MKKNLNWLVTGSAGFIGSNLVSFLIDNGQDVIGIDNLSTGKMENVGRVLSSQKGKYEFFELDICSLNDVEYIFKKSFDVVVHLAAQGSVQKSFSDVLHNNRQNIDGFLNVFLASGEAKIRRLIYASSCAVYGEVHELPITEKYSPQPVSPYATSKLTNDLLASNLASSFPDTEFFGLRFFNIFGPYQDPSGDYAAVIPKWIELLLSGGQPVIFGDGLATRDFCYVENISKLILDLGLKTKRPSNFQHVFNIASQKATSLNILFDILTSCLRQRGLELRHTRPIYKPWREGDILHSLGSIELAKNELGFRVDVGLREGILKILAEQYGI